jgi:hypothetical protein
MNCTECILNGDDVMSGKGSSPRPFSVSQDKFAENWDRVFGKKSESDIRLREQALDELAAEAQRLEMYDDK